MEPKSSAADIKSVVAEVLKHWDSPAYNMRPTHHVGEGEREGTEDAVKLYTRKYDEQ